MRSTFSAEHHAPPWGLRSRTRAGVGGLFTALMVSGPGSVAPVHDSGDLADNRAPSERSGGLCLNLAHSPPCEERTETTGFHCAQSFVQIVQWGTRRQRVDYRLQTQRVPDVTGQFTRLDDEFRVDGVVAAAEVLDDEVQLVAVLVQGHDVLCLDPLPQLGPTIQLGEFMVVRTADVV